MVVELVVVIVVEEVIADVVEDVLVVVGDVIAGLVEDVVVLVSSDGLVVVVVGLSEVLSSVVVLDDEVVFDVIGVVSVVLVIGSVELKKYTSM